MRGIFLIFIYSLIFIYFYLLLCFSFSQIPSVSFLVASLILHPLFRVAISPFLVLLTMPCLIFKWEHLPCHKENRKQPPTLAGPLPHFPFCHLHILQQEQSSFPLRFRRERSPINPVSSSSSPLVSPSKFLFQRYLRNLKVTCLGLIQWSHAISSPCFSDALVCLPFLRSTQAQGGSQSSSHHIHPPYIHTTGRREEEQGARLLFKELPWKSHVAWSADMAELSDMAFCSSKEGWEMWFFKEKHSGFSKNHTAQGSVIKTKYRINTGRQLEVSTHWLVKEWWVGMRKDPHIIQGPGRKWTVESTGFDWRKRQRCVQGSGAYPWTSNGG